MDPNRTKAKACGLVIIESNKYMWKPPKLGKILQINSVFLGDSLTQVGGRRRVCESCRWVFQAWKTMLGDIPNHPHH